MVSIISGLSGAFGVMARHGVGILKDYHSSGWDFEWQSSWTVWSMIQAIVFGFAHGYFAIDPTTAFLAGYLGNKIVDDATIKTVNKMD